MTRRIYTYQPEMGWTAANQLATIGAVVILLGGIVFMVNVAISMRRGEEVGANPWEAGTLEWATASPPPNYNFVYLPCATSRYPLWAASDERVVVTGLRNDRHEVLVTSVMDAEPRHRYVLPGPSIWPLLAALAVSVGFIGSVFNPRWVMPGSFLTAIALIGWFWPRPPLELEP
jgi:cytochrome c oxidase subunit 1